MDTKSHIFTLLFQDINHFSHGILSLGHSQTISGDNDNVLGLNHGVDGIITSPLSVFAGDGHGLTAASGGGAKPAQDDVGQGPVHGHAHDVAEDGTGATDQGADDGHQVVVQHEALGAQGPSGVGVEDRDDHGHVGAADGHGQGDSHDGGETGGRAQHGKADIVVGTG